MAKHLPTDVRKDEILNAALRVCEKPNGWAKLTRAQVAFKANCSEGLVSKYFGTMTAFRRQVMRAAITQENLKVLGQGLGAGDATALKAPNDLKVKAIGALIL